MAQVMAKTAPQLDNTSRVTSAAENGNQQSSTEMATRIKMA
jgi:hypothetical protein